MMRDLLLGALVGLASFLAVVWVRCWAQSRRLRNLLKLVEREWEHLPTEKR
jgi:hypothetical protein